MTMVFTCYTNYSVADLLLQDMNISGPCDFYPNISDMYDFMSSMCGYTARQYIILLFSFLIFGVIGNVFFISDFRREKNMQTDINVYFLNLSASNFLFLCVEAIIQGVSFVGVADTIGEGVQLTHYITMWTSVCTSTFFMIVISADCYLSFRHHSYTTTVRHRRKYRSRLFTSIVWLLGSCIGSVIAFCEFKTLTDAWKIGKLIFLCILTSFPILLAATFFVLVAYKAMRIRKFNRSRHHFEDNQTIQMCLLTFLAYVVCSIPLTCYFPIALYSRVTGHFHIVGNAVLVFCIARYFGVSIMINFAANTIIFNLGCKMHRHALLDCLTQCCRPEETSQQQNKPEEQRVNGTCPGSRESETEC